MNQRFLFLIAFPLLWFGAWALFGLVSVGMRPALPVFELPVLAQAWDTWQHKTFLLPGSGIGQEDFPLYLWVIHGTWAAFGVSDAWPRFLPSAMGFGSTLMVAALARALWPGWSGLGVLCAAIFMGISGYLGVTFLSGQTVLLVLCVLISLFGLVTAWRRGTWDGLILSGVGLGLGFLTSGYEILVHVLPVALLTPLWAPALGWREGTEATEDAAVNWRYWYGRLGIAVLIGCLVVGVWIVPLGMKAGISTVFDVLLAPLRSLFDADISGARQWWLYLLFLILGLFPWIIWPPAYRALVGLLSMIKDGGGRFCLIWLLPPVVAAAVWPGTRPVDIALHAPALAISAGYLLYLRMEAELARQETQRRFGNGEATLGLFVALLRLVLIVLPLAGGLLTLPWWITGLSGAWGGALILIGAVAAYAAPRMIIFRASMVMCQIFLVALVGMMAVFPMLTAETNINPIAKHVRLAVDRETAIGVAGSFGRDLAFPARLVESLDTLDPNDTIGVIAWAAGHPGGEIAVMSPSLPAGEQPMAVFPYLGQYLVFWSTETIATQPDLVFGESGSAPATDQESDASLSISGQ